MPSRNSESLLLQVLLDFATHMLITVVVVVVRMMVMMVNKNSLRNLLNSKWVLAATWTPWPVSMPTPWDNVLILPVM